MDDMAPPPPEGGASPDEPDRTTLDEIRRWDRRLRRARSEDREHRKRQARWCRELAGEIDGEHADDPRLAPGEDDEDAGTAHVALLYATMQAVVPYLYAQDPEIAISPSEAVADVQHEAVRAFSETLEAVLARQFRDARLKARAERCLIVGMTTGVGAIKVSYQRDYAADAIATARIPDSQDNVARMRSLLDQTAGGTDSTSTPEETALASLELERQTAAFEQSLEVVVAEGIVLDVVPAADLVIDPAMREIVDYEQARWIAHQLWIPLEDARAQFSLTDREMKSVTRYNEAQARAREEREATGTTREGAPGRIPGIDAAAGDDGYVRVVEVWERTSQTVFTLMDGLKRWAREPWQPPRQAERWYPFHLLLLNPVPERRWPLSDVELMRSLQKEYHDTRAKLRDHRERAVPARVGLKDHVSEDDARKIARPDLNEMVLLEAGDQPNPNVNQMVGILPYPPIDPALYDTQPILRDLEMMSGAQDAQRSTMVKPKTATEAEIMRSGMLSRTQWRRDTLEAFIEQLAQATAEILLQELTPEQAQRLAGAGAQWPSLSRAEVYDLVRIEVRAGTSGKPNKDEERAQWLEFLPQLRELVMQVAQLRANPATAPLAESLIEIARETLRRFDERLEVERFLPGAAPLPLRLAAASMGGAPGNVVPMPGAAPAPGVPPGQEPAAPIPGLGQIAAAAVG